MKPLHAFGVLTIIFLLLYTFADNSSQTGAGQDADYKPINRDGLTPNWSAIAEWPPTSEETSTPLAKLDPWQVTTLIVLDDSGSMKSQIAGAKSALVDAVRRFDPDSRVGVIALNAGPVADVAFARDAAAALPAQLDTVQADGGTPLGARLIDAANILAGEAGSRRGFGVFRILVATDGAASDSAKLNAAVTRILSNTPIELATIGIGIGEGHALNVPGFTSYVSVASVDGLAQALSAAAAEQTTFKPISEFTE